MYDSRVCHFFISEGAYVGLKGKQPCICIYLDTLFDIDILDMDIYNTFFFLFPPLLKTLTSASG